MCGETMELLTHFLARVKDSAGCRKANHIQIGSKTVCFGAMEYGMMRWTFEGCQLQSCRR